MECPRTVDCPPVTDKHKNAAKKFRDGDTGKSDDFPDKKAFASQPAEANGRSCPTAQPDAVGW